MSAKFGFTASRQRALKLFSFASLHKDILHMVNSRVNSDTNGHRTKTLSATKIGVHKKIYPALLGTTEVKLISN